MHSNCPIYLAPCLFSAYFSQNSASKMYLDLLLTQQLPCAVHCMHSMVDLTHLPCPINNFKNSAQYCGAILASFQGLPHFDHRSSTLVHYRKSKKLGRPWNETKIAPRVMRSCGTPLTWMMSVGTRWTKIKDKVLQNLCHTQPQSFELKGPVTFYTDITYVFHSRM